MKRKIFILFIFLPVLIFIYQYNKDYAPKIIYNLNTSTTTEKVDIDMLSYSNTQVELEPFMQDALKFKVNYLPTDWESKVKLDPPAKNSSTTTQKEILELHKMIEERTLETINKINAELKVEGMYICDISINNFLKNKDKNIKTLFIRFSKDILHATIVEKLFFARIRPSILDKTLTTAIDVPMHPSYPSGHSAQFYAYALLLSEFFPDRKEEFIGCARQVAKRREIAGLHYQSDSKAGEMLAEQAYSLMKPKMLEEIKKIAPLIIN